MQHDQSLAEITAAIFSRFDPVLRDIKPDWVLAEGDTTTVMATALLAYYNRIRFGHVEAGLRSGDKWQPFPEEINRKVAGVVADFHFAPTEWSRQNLLRENVCARQIVVTGNPVIDALQFAAKQPLTPAAPSLLRQIGLPEKETCNGCSPRLVLVTAHRRENFGAPLEGWLREQYNSSAPPPLGSWPKRAGCWTIQRLMTRWLAPSILMVMVTPPNALSQQYLV